VQQLILPTMYSTIQETPIYGIMIIHMELSKATTNITFSQMCGVVSLVTNSLLDELSALLENVPLQTRRQMYYQHDGAQPRFSQVVRQYLNLKFPNQWTDRGGSRIGHHGHWI